MLKITRFNPTEKSDRRAVKTLNIVNSLFEHASHQNRIACIYGLRSKPIFISQANLKKY